MEQGAGSRRDCTTGPLTTRRQDGGKKTPNIERPTPNDELMFMFILMLVLMLVIDKGRQSLAVISDEA